MSLLSIVVEVCGRIDLQQPTAVVGSADPQVTQLYALTNKAGHDLGQAYNWQALIEEQTFTTTATAGQTAAIPTDLDHFIQNSFFNRTTRRPVDGPITPQQWQALQAQPALNTVYLMFRERAGQFIMSPTPPAGQVIAYEYISKNWAKSAAGTPQASFLADTDTSFLDESLTADAVVWMYLRAKGLSYAEEMQTYSRNLQQQQARDGGSTALSLTPEPFSLDRVNLPDGNFPGA